VTDTEASLDPEFSDLPELLSDLSLSTKTLASIRRRFASAPDTQASDAFEYRDYPIAAVNGGDEVMIRVRRPVGVDGALPCLYGVHGLGFVAGGRNLGDAPAAVWCRRLRCTVVSVEQRLAPETAYPGPLEDCYTGLRWIFQNATGLGIDPLRIGVNGGGSGGALAAGLCLLARDRGEVPIRFQVLFYPMLDDRRLTPSNKYRASVWSPDANQFAWRSYLGALYGTDQVPGYAAPCRAADLAGLPPAYILVGALDGLSDEGIDYARRLNQAGVATDFHMYAGAPHAFLGLVPSARVSRRAHRELLSWLERRMWPPGLPYA
jgi:acetyl esterase/lipase